MKKLYVLLLLLLVLSATLALAEDDNHEDDNHHSLSFHESHEDEGSDSHRAYDDESWDARDDFIVVQQDPVVVETSVQIPVAPVVTLPSVEAIAFANLSLNMSREDFNKLYAEINQYVNASSLSTDMNSSYKEYLVNTGYQQANASGSSDLSGTVVNQGNVYSGNSKFLNMLYALFNFLRGKYNGI